MIEKHTNNPPVHPPINGRMNKTSLIYDYHAVEAELVEAAALWHRSPRVGPAPLRSAWPRDTIDLYADAWGRSMMEPGGAAPAPLPLTRGEVAARDAVSEWLMLVEDETSRRVLALAVSAKAAGAARVPWSRIMRAMGQARGREGIKKRYERGIDAICRGLNKGQT